MDWEQPQIIVIEMNAEIGAYQGDFDGDIVRAEPAREAPLGDPESGLAQAPADR